MLNSGTNSHNFNASGAIQDGEKTGGFSFKDLNLSGRGSSIDDIFSINKPVLTNPFNLGAPRENKPLINSNLEFDFHKAEIKATLPASEPKLKPEPKPEPTLTDTIDSSVLTEYANRYSSAFASTLSCVAFQRNQETDIIVYDCSHSLVTSDDMYVYSLVNTPRGALITTVNFVNRNAVRKYALNINEYINIIETDVFNGYLLLFSQTSAILHILKRSTREITLSYPNVFAYYSYSARYHKRTYLILLVADEQMVGLYIHIIDLQTLAIHQCPTPILISKVLSSQLQELLEDPLHEFHRDDIKRAYLAPFGTSSDTDPKNALSSSKRGISMFFFEELVFYVGVELLLSSHVTVLAHAMVGPILLEKLSSRIAPGFKIKASTSIRTIANSEYSTDFYIVRQIQPVKISDNYSKSLIDITPIAICSSDDQVCTHYFLHVCLQDQKSTASLYELLGAESFLYGTNQPITLSLADPVFSRSSEGVQIYRVQHIRERMSTDGVGAKILIVGVKTITDGSHQLITSVFDAAGISLEETAVTLKSDSPVLLGYDHNQGFAMCASTLLTTATLLHKISQTSKVADVDGFNSATALSILPNQSLTNQALASSVPTAASLKKYIAFNDYLADALDYVRKTPAGSMDLNALEGKLKDLNNSIVFLASYSLSNAQSPIKALLSNIEGLLIRIINNNSLLLQVMQRIKKNLSHLFTTNDNACEEVEEAKEDPLLTDL